MEFYKLEKVWVHDGDSKFPGIVVDVQEEGLTIAKFDTVVWRNVFVSPDVVSKRNEGFEEFMWQVRQRFMPIAIKYFLP